MNCSFFPPVRAALLGAAFVGLTATAASAVPVQSGVLACNVAPGVGFVIGSSKNLSCVFHRARGRPEYYAGTINRIRRRHWGDRSRPVRLGRYHRGASRPPLCARRRLWRPRHWHRVRCRRQRQFARRRLRQFDKPAAAFRRNDRPQFVRRHRRPNLAACRGRAAGTTPASWLNQGIRFASRPGLDERSLRAKTGAALPKGKSCANLVIKSSSSGEYRPNLPSGRANRPFFGKTPNMVIL